MTEQTQTEFPPNGAPPSASDDTPISKKPSLALANTALVLGVYAVAGPPLFMVYWNSSAAGTPVLDIILGISVLLGPPAVLMAIAALVLKRSRQQRYRGTGRALAGLVCGLLGLGWGYLHVIRARAIVYGPWGTVIKSETRANLECVGEVLRTWANDHDGEFPADLAEIYGIRSDTDGCLLVFHLSDVPDCTVTDFHYISGLDRACPADWILAYADPSYFNDEGGGVLCVDGSVELLDEPAFSERIETFGAVYNAARGEPPNVVAPH